ncbi:spore coat protein SA [Glaciecola punicea ACAM 611]|uniref:Spore coat protein SA n=1 Tax=Glaciecola punicea ACAM 611 TaxID=1121923 RepID=H5TF66_9ALTE|nr:glycosyltransferase family 4 protein [Glaciecola punicea]GAB56993.1 spore coat protein SA [Glaciecola punicea ACAM 611]
MLEATNKQILLLTNMYPTDRFPAKGSFVKRSAVQLVNAGFEVKVVTLKDIKTKMLEYALFYSRVVRKLLLQPASYVYIHFVSHTAVPVLFVIALRKLLRKSPHIIVSHVHGGDVHFQTNKNKLFFAVKRLLAKQILHRSDVIISPSHRYADIVRKLLMSKQQIGGFAPDKHSPDIRVICSAGVDLTKFGSVSFTKSGIGLENLKFVYLSRFEPLKQPLLTLNYLDELYRQKPEYFSSAKFYGYGSLTQELNSGIAESLMTSEKVKCYDAVPSDRVPSLFADNDAFILQSKEESLGLAPLEAMASGCVVFLSKIPAFEEFIEDGKNGFLISSKEEFIGKVEDFCSWPFERQQELQQAARNTVQQSYSSLIAERDLIDVFVDKSRC